MRLENHGPVRLENHGPVRLDILRRLRHADHRRLGPYKGENKCPVGGDYHGLDWARAII